MHYLQVKRIFVDRLSKGIEGENIKIELNHWWENAVGTR